MAVLGVAQMPAVPGGDADRATEARIIPAGGRFEYPREDPTGAHGDLPAGYQLRCMPCWHGGPREWRPRGLLES